MREPALWAIRAGLVEPPSDAPMWVRLGKDRALRLLSIMHDQLCANVSRPFGHTEDEPPHVTYGGFAAETQVSGEWSGGTNAAQEWLGG